MRMPLGGWGCKGSTLYKGGGVLDMTGLLRLAEAQGSAVAPQAICDLRLQSGCVNLFIAGAAASMEAICGVFFPMHSKAEPDPARIPMSQPSSESLPLLGPDVSAHRAVAFGVAGPPAANCCTVLVEFHWLGPKTVLL